MDREEGITIVERVSFTYSEMQKSYPVIRFLMTLQHYRIWQVAEQGCSVFFAALRQGLERMEPPRKLCGKLVEVETSFPPKVSKHIQAAGYSVPDMVSAVMDGYFGRLKTICINTEFAAEDD